MNASEYERIQLIEGQQVASEKVARETRVREALARVGYRLMHRRGQQYWMLPTAPQTLDEIETWLKKSNRKAH
jgi:hypothetical protein